jgi:hypothetical protein
VRLEFADMYKFRLFHSSLIFSKGKEVPEMKTICNEDMSFKTTAMQGHVNWSSHCAAVD